MVPHVPNIPNGRETPSPWRLLSLHTVVHGRLTVGVERQSCVNVNTTDATTGATALLLPAQNTPYIVYSYERDTLGSEVGCKADCLASQTPS